MDSASDALPDLDGLSLAELKALLHQQHAELLSSRAELLSHRAEIEALKLQILKLRRLQFGQRSEKRAREIEQLELWVEELEAADAHFACALAEHLESPPAAGVSKPRRQFPVHLPRETQVVAPTQSACPDCGGALKHLGEDVSEMLELEPVRFKVIRRVRPKLACARCDTIVQAPAPSRLIERGMAGPGLLAHVLAGKYADHLPLYRQAEIYAREGVELDRTLLAQWVGSTSALLAPLTDALHKHVFTADVVHADDTPIPVLAPGRGKTKTGRLWTYVRDERPSAGAVAPERPRDHKPQMAGEAERFRSGGHPELSGFSDPRPSACRSRHIRQRRHQVRVLLRWRGLGDRSQEKYRESYRRGSFSR
jgi:transposase